MKRSFIFFWKSIVLTLLYTTNINAQCIVLGDNLGPTTIESVKVGGLTYNTSETAIQENANIVVLIDETTTHLPISLKPKATHDFPSTDSIYWQIWIDENNDNLLDVPEIVYTTKAASNLLIFDNVDITGLALPLGQAVAMRILLTDTLAILHDPCDDHPSIINPSFKIVDLRIKEDRSGGRISATNTSNGLLDGCGDCVKKDEFNFELINNHAFEVTSIQITKIRFNYESGNQTPNLVGNGSNLYAIAQIRPDGASINYLNQNLPISGLKPAYRASLRLHFPIFILEKGCGSIQVQGIYKTCDNIRDFQDTIPVEFKCNHRDRITFAAPTDKHVVFQPYPNPFQNQLQLSYHLEKQEYVKITLYNLSGKLIRTLFRDEKQAGIHHLSVDTSALDKGVYICSVQIDDSVFTHLLSKME